MLFLCSHPCLWLDCLLAVLASGSTEIREGKEGVSGGEKLFHLLCRHPHHQMRLLAFWRKKKKNQTSAGWGVWCLASSSCSVVPMMLLGKVQFWPTAVARVFIIIWDLIPWICFQHCQSKLWLWWKEFYFQTITSSLHLTATHTGKLILVILVMTPSWPLQRLFN